MSSTLVLLKSLALLSLLFFSYLVTADDHYEYDINDIGLSLEEQLGLEPNKYMPTLEQLRQWDKERSARKANGKVVVIDTRDQKVCRDFQVYLSSKGIEETAEGSVDQLCDSSADQSPYLTFMAIDQEEEEMERIRRKVERYRRMGANPLIKDTVNMLHLGGGGLALLYAAPSEYTNWDRQKRTTDDLDEKIGNNIMNGPVMDKDNVFVNFVGHPLSGAWYYLIARNNNIGHWGSFGYSVLMSTFYWEYGLEAFFEEPSIQDLIITPVIGSIMGELFYYAIEGIKASDGKLLGSKDLGSTAMMVMNPLEGALNQVESVSEVFEKYQLRGTWVAIPTKDIYRDNNPEVDTIEDLHRGRGEFGGTDFMIGFFVQGVF